MKKIIVALLMLTACGTSVFAADWTKDGSVLLGYGMPGSDIGSIIDGGIALGLEYDGYKINDTFSVGGAFMYTGGKGNYDPAGIGSGEYKLSVWGLTPYIKASKEVDLGGKKANVYGLFGLGFYGSSVEVYSVSASGSDFGLNLGGGIMFPMGDKMKLGADLRYHLIASNLTYFIPSVKFTYSF